MTQRITEGLLKKHLGHHPPITHICRDFAEKWPDGVELSEEVLLWLAHEKMDMYTFVRKFYPLLIPALSSLTEGIRDEYYKQLALLWEDIPLKEARAAWRLIEAASRYGP